MENNKNIPGIFSKFRNYIPFAAIFILTAGLLFYFKENRNSVGDLIESGKTGLLSFYTQNLKPILFKTEITDEDVFNFALYKNLPIDKEENKVLQIGYDEESGNEFFEVKPAEINGETKNYEKFVEYLKLDEDRKAELDSILNYYKDKIYTSILYNDNKTIAIDSKVSLLRDAVLADLMAFAENTEGVNAGNLGKDFYKYDNIEVKNAIAEINDEKGTDFNDFIVFTPDSIFNSEFEINKKKLNEEMTALNWDMNQARSELDNINLEIKINPSLKDEKELIKSTYSKTDSNYRKAIIPKALMMKGMQSKMDVEKLRENITKLTEEINKVKIKVKKDAKHKVKLDLGNVFYGDSSASFTFNLKLDNLDSLIENSVRVFNTKEIDNLENLGVKIDSIVNSYQFNFTDSLFNKKDLEELKKEIRKSKRELKKELQ